MQPPHARTRALWRAARFVACLALFASLAACSGGVPNVASQRAEYERAMHYQQQAEDPRIGRSKAADLRSSPGAAWSAHARAGRQHLAAGETEQAEREFLSSLEATGHFRPKDARARAAVSNLQRLADQLFASGDMPATIRITPTLIVAIERGRGPDDPALPLAWRRLAEARVSQGLLAGAEANLVRSTTLYRSLADRNYLAEAEAASVLGRVYEAQGKLAKAEATYRSAAEDADSRGAEELDLAFSLNGLAWFYARHERYADAEPFARRAVEIAVRLGLPRREVGLTRDTHASSLAGLGRNDEADEQFQKAIAESRGQPSIVLNYAAFLRGIGRSKEAAALEAKLAPAARSATSRLLPQAARKARA
jgi:tetratricopeptide (TPR) repeat protein